LCIDEYLRERIVVSNNVATEFILTIFTFQTYLFDVRLLKPRRLLVVSLSHNMNYVESAVTQIIVQQLHSVHEDSAHYSQFKEQPPQLWWREKDRHNFLN
jgi:hypothetical protein